MTLIESLSTLPAGGDRNDPSLATRASLLDRLLDVKDQSSWHRFYDTYSPLIRGVARKAGLTVEEAEDVLQETIISVARHLPGFHYDPARCSFRTWMLRVTRWRIIDQFRRRLPAAEPLPAPLEDDTTAVNLLDQLAGDAAAGLEALWKEEWERRVLDTALAEVRKTSNPSQFQMFELYALRQVPVTEVARLLGVNVARVYLAKHRIAAALKREIARLEDAAPPAAPMHKAGMSQQLKGNIIAPKFPASKHL